MMIACVVVKIISWTLNIERRLGGWGLLMGLGVNGVCLIVCLLEELNTQRFFFLISKKINLSQIQMKQEIEGA